MEIKDNIEFKFDIKTTFFNLSTEDKLLNPFIIICSDNSFKMKPIKITIATKEYNNEENNKIYIGSMGNSKISMQIESKIKEKKGDYLIGKMIKSNEKYFKDKLPEDSRFIISLYYVTYSDDMLPITSKCAVGTVKLGDCVNNEKVNVTLKTSSGESLGKLNISLNNAPEGLEANLLKIGGKVGDNDDHKIISRYLLETRQWFEKVFRYVFAKTNRIHWYEDFNMAGKNAAVGFVLGDCPSINADYALNLFYYGMQDYRLIGEMASGKIMGDKYSKGLSGMRKDFLNMDQKNKAVAIAFMITQVSNAYTYMTDQAQSLIQRMILTKESFETPDWGGSGDCEDFSRENMKIVEALQDLKIKPSDNLEKEEVEVIKAIQSVLNLYIPLMTLCRVTLGRSDGVSGIEYEDLQLDDIYAHMTVLMIPKAMFFKMAGLEKILPEYENPEVIKQSKAIEPFYLEGTGPFFPFALDDKKYKKHKKLFVDKKNRNIIDSLFTKYRFQGPNSSEPFFLTLMKGCTDYFIKKKNVPLHSFIFSCKKGKDEYDYQYGYSFDEFMNISGENEPVFISEPEMSQKEMKAVISLSRLHKTPMKRKIAKTNSIYVRKKRSHLNSSTFNTCDLFKPAMENWIVQSKDDSIDKSAYFKRNDVYKQNIWDYLDQLQEKVSKRYKSEPVSDKVPHLYMKLNYHLFGYRKVREWFEDKMLSDKNIYDFYFVKKLLGPNLISLGIVIRFK